MPPVEEESTEPCPAALNESVEFSDRQDDSPYPHQKYKVKDILSTLYPWVYQQYNDGLKQRRLWFIKVKTVDKTVYMCIKDKHFFD